MAYFTAFVMSCKILPRKSSCFVVFCSKAHKYSGKENIPVQVYRQKYYSSFNQLLSLEVGSDPQKKSLSSRHSPKFNLAAKYLRNFSWVEMEIKSIFFKLKLSPDCLSRLHIRKQTGGISVVFSPGIKGIWRPNPGPWWVPDFSLITLLERVELMSFCSEFFQMQFSIKTQ